MGAWLGWGTPLGAAIFRVWPDILSMLQAGVQRHVAPALWDWLFLPPLTWPVWALPGGLGALLLLLGLLRRR